MLVDVIMTGDEGGDTSSNWGVLGDLPRDHHAEPASVSVRDLERELVEQTMPGGSPGDTDGGGAGGGPLEPRGEVSDGHEQFTINDYYAQARTRRRSSIMSTVSRSTRTMLSDLGDGSAYRSSSRYSAVSSDLGGASADRETFVDDAGPSSAKRRAMNVSRIVRRPGETLIIKCFNNMADRGMYNNINTHFELDETGHLREGSVHSLLQHGDAHAGHVEGLPWYAHPIQRQRWNEDHVLPHVDWGDLFFDLFYVGAGEKVMCSSFGSKRISIFFRLTHSLIHSV